ncbi:MAG: hypothetical protein R6W91_05210 [Thermoplasmata archaeon]
MARKSAKKARKSGKTDPKKSSPDAEKKPPAKAAKANTAGAPKKAAIHCQFCNKPMKNEKTKKIHEGNCKAKSPAQQAPKQNDFESALLELKDRFDDDRQRLAQSFQEREDHMQRELEEVKTVLRLEIDRHRKELERISKVEREVEESQAPEPKPEEPESPIPVEEIPPPIKEEPLPEPQRMRSQQPRAIDMIPLRIPTIPRKAIPPMDGREAIPDIDDELPPRAEPGLGKEAIEEIVRNTLEQFTPQAAVAPDIGKLEGKVGQIAGRLDDLDTKLERGTSELRKTIEKTGKGLEIRKIEKDLEKISERVMDIMEDSGYGESLSVSKIPPTILEIVYQAILDDVHIEIIRTKGPQDAERIARSALEEVRLKTSGSELFKFDGRKIVTDNLAKSIESTMISAKQIQTTYDVLMERLLETVPHHKAKNFKGMIKIKSQEFAVDRATRLTKEFGRMEKVLESTSQMVAAMSANFNSQNLDIHEKLKILTENTMATKAEQEDLNALRAKLEESNERIIKLADEMAMLRAELDMKSAIKEKEEAVGDDVFLTPGEEPFVSSPDIPEDGVFTAQPAPSGSPDSTDAQAEDVLGAVAGGANSKTAIIKKTGLNESAVKEKLAVLIEARKIIEKRAGKRTIYTTLELELEKAKEDEPPQKGKKPGKKARGKAAKPAPEPMPEPAPEAETPPDITGPGVVVLDDDGPEQAAEPVPEEPAESLPEQAVEQAPEESTEPPEPVPEQVIEPAPEESVESPEPAPEQAIEPKSEDLIEPPEPEKKPASASKKKKGKKKPAKQETDVPEQPRDEPPESPEPVPDKGGSKAFDDLPVVKKSLSELSEDEHRVLDALTEDAMALSGIQSKVGKGMKRFELLRALRVLIDSGHVGIIAKGRMELYQKITVEKMYIPKEKKNKKEVK